MLVDVAELQEPWEGQRKGFYVKRRKGENYYAG